MSRRPSSSRRDFLKTSAVAGATAAVSLGLAGNVHAAGGDVLKVGLIGCGGRGTDAATQALRADPNVKLVALGDAFMDQVQHSLTTLKGDPELAKKIDVPKDQCFDGFDAYKKVFDLCDVVLLCTPPHFRPAHLEYGVKVGKHMFVEKPVAVDPPGIRRVFNACAEAKKKNLSIVSGLCWRYHNGKRETFKRVLDGSIGDITGLQCTYNTGKLWKKDRKKDMTTGEWQIRNWLYFAWLSGDHIVEQAVHSLDKMGWAMRDEPPIKVTAVGGRQSRTAPEYGHIFDHFGVVYEYAGGVKMFHFCRQQEGCSSDVSDHIFGTKGFCDVFKHKITGAKSWVYEAPEGLVDNMYQTEHNELFAGIRNSKPINNGDYMTKSSMLAIVGRMAAYTGKTITWDAAMKSDLDLTPKAFADGYRLCDLPMPRVAKPGITPLTDTLW